MQSRRTWRLLVALGLLLPKASCRAEASAAAVKPGIEVLLTKRLASLRGKRIGLVTHAAAVDSALQATTDLLFRNPALRLTVLMAPEHGIRGEQWAGESVPDQKDQFTGLPVYSLYGKTSKPTPEVLKQLDVLVYDVQDVGTRSYTFLYTLTSVMDAAAEAGLPVIVLDRPNPLGGERVEGNVPEPGWKPSEVCALPIPYNYGMTVGELALMINGEGWLPQGRRCRLEVIPMEGWRRQMSFRDTGLPWVPTSPNIPRAESAFYYAATELLGELRILNEGVGTPLPFELLGAPWIDGQAFAAKLNALRLPGVLFRPITYKPFYGTYQKTTCHGVQIHMLDPFHAPWSALELRAMEALHELYPQRPLWDGDGQGSAAAFDRLACGRLLRQEMQSGIRVDELFKSWQARDAEFSKARERYLLYP